MTIFKGRLRSCRHCGSTDLRQFCDLGLQPPSNHFVRSEDAHRAEKYLPLSAVVCTNCWLAQLDFFEDATALFNDDYAYFSSYSTSWLAHAEAYAKMMIERFRIDAESFVVEVASNDGYLLKNFKAAGVAVLGVEPSENVAQAARENHGIPTEVTFFGKAEAGRLRTQYGAADLIAGNNVLAHVPDINDFVAGVPCLLKDDGVVTFEFPHLQNLLDYNQFDTIYHEHFTYLSLHAVHKVLTSQGLRVFDVEPLPTHGGSLRVFGCHSAAMHETTDRVAATLKAENAAGLTDLAAYGRFQERVRRIKRDFLRFLIDAKEAGKSICAYGAAAKGNTLLNYAGVGTDMIDMVADKNPQKQNRLLPGSHVPVVAPDQMLAAKPDYVVILPWNLKEEIAEQLRCIRAWNGKFVVAIPQLAVF